MKKVYLLLCILWIGFVFYNSSVTGVESNNVSYSIVNKIINENERKPKEEVKKDKSIGIRTNNERSINRNKYINNRLYDIQNR